MPNFILYNDQISLVTITALFHVVLHSTDLGKANVVCDGLTHVQNVSLLVCDQEKAIQSLSGGHRRQRREGERDVSEAGREGGREGGSKGRREVYS